MMGKPRIGEIAALNDTLLNHIMEGQNIEGILTKKGRHNMDGDRYSYFPHRHGWVFLDVSFCSFSNISP